MHLFYRWLPCWFIAVFAYAALRRMDDETGVVDGGVTEPNRVPVVGVVLLPRQSAEGRLPLAIRVWNAGVVRHGDLVGLQEVMPSALKDEIKLP